MFTSVNSNTDNESSCCWFKSLNLIFKTIFLTVFLSSACYANTMSLNISDVVNASSGDDVLQGRGDRDDDRGGHNDKDKKHGHKDKCDLDDDLDDAYGFCADKGKKGRGNKDKVDVCHLSCSSDIVNICIKEKAFNKGHLKHGDYLAITFYEDSDGDGFGNPDSTQLACTAPDGFVADNTDCDDNNPDAFPGNMDANCDGVDNSCSGVADDEYVSLGTTCGIGECVSTGSTSCVDGSVVDSCLAGTPTSDANCDGLDNNCNGTPDDEYVSVVTNCGVGTCASVGSTSCVDGSVIDSCVAGSPTTEICDGLDNDCDTVVDNGGDSLCDNGQFCDGSETCGGTAGCLAGVAPVIDDGVGCTDDSCDEVNDVVVNTANDANCDNGLFCDGSETCDVVNDCVAGVAPNIDDGVACTDDSCDEANDVVVNTANDANCDNGLFCDGSETCDAVNDCVAGIAPSINDGIGCTDDSCDEVNDVVVNTANDANCDNGLFCDGSETCDASLDCQAGVAPDLDDGLGCTNDSCDEATDVVVHTPDDSLCNDNNVCTDDFCSISVGCQASNNSYSETCYTDLNTSPGVGECSSGTATCSNGVLGACEGQTLPAAETCSDLGIDNDCDGDISDFDDDLSSDYSNCGTCGNACTFPYGCGSLTPGVCEECGDGATNGPEECDNGSSNSDTVADACRTDCTNARCGDGVVDTGEECDDGNIINGDGCDSACHAYVLLTCGNGHVEANEECDDSNTSSGDGCSANCTLESSVACPNACTNTVFATEGWTATAGDNGSWSGWNVVLDSSHTFRLESLGSDFGPECGKDGCIFELSLVAGAAQPGSPNSLHVNCYAEAGLESTDRFGFENGLASTINGCGGGVAGSQELYCAYGLIVNEDVIPYETVSAIFQDCLNIARDRQF